MFQWHAPPPQPEVVDHGRDFKRLNAVAVHRGVAEGAPVACPLPTLQRAPPVSSVVQW